MSESVLILEDVCRYYLQGSQQVRALDHVSLSFETGDFVAVAGPSGSGKTTLLNVAAGLDEPDSGRISVAGQDLTGLSRSARAQLRLRKVGFIFQSFNLIPVLTARENAEFVLLLRGTPAAERRARVDRLLEEVGLAGMEDRRPGELSGGQQQRVAVARAVAAEPALVLADEPTANLDSQTAASLLDVLQRLNRDHGTTFLFSTHDSRVMERARRLVQLLDGQVASDQVQMPEPGVGSGS